MKSLLKKKGGGEMKIKHWFFMKYHKIMLDFTIKYSQKWDKHKQQYKYYNNKFVKMHYRNKMQKVVKVLDKLKEIAKRWFNKGWFNPLPLGD